MQKRFFGTLAVLCTLGVLALVGVLLLGACTQQQTQAKEKTQANPAKSAPASATAATTTWKLQSGFPAISVAHKAYERLAKKIDEMSGGRLKIEVTPGGTIVPPFEVPDAVGKLVLDAGGTVPAYYVGKHAGASLFGTGPSFGMDANDLLAWEYYGGGWDLYQELLQKELGLNLVAFHFGPIPTQPFGWFKKPVRSADDLKGSKYRTVGLAAELFQGMGASVVSLPGGEIIPALERGVIDAAEWNNPTDDKNLGFPQVAKYYHLQSYHQPVEYLELIINKGKWDALPADLKAIIRYAVMAESADWSWMMLDLNSKDLEELVANQGIQIIITPPEILKAQLDGWDKITEKYTKDPKVGAFFSKVVESQKQWAKRVVPYKVQIYVPNQHAYEKYWKK
jgi:TRAP-type mannitol/chloroaromatic compound transport system substrate-binding protein